jgi:hypothetical protein
MIRPIFLEVVIQSWLRKELTLKLGSSDHPMLWYKMWMWMWMWMWMRITKRKGWHLDAEENEIEDAMYVEEIVKE